MKLLAWVSYVFETIKIEMRGSIGNMLLHIRSRPSDSPMGMKV